STNTNNSGSQTGCGDATEQVVVGPHPTNLVTHQSDADGHITVGDSVHDTATLSGGFGTQTGSISFQLYKSADCSSPIGDPITSTNTNTSGSQTGCGDATEQVVVGPHPTNLVTHQSDADGHITVGDSVHDTATLSGGFGTQTGSISFQLYKSADCSSPIGDP